MSPPVWERQPSGSPLSISDAACLDPTCDFLHPKLSLSGSSRPLLTHTVVADTAVRGPGWPEHLAGEAVFQLYHLPVDHHLPGPRGRSVCGAACVV